MLGKLKEISPNIERLRDELEWFGSLTPAPALRDNAIWDKVVVGEEDRIFPMANQLNAWEGYDVFTVAGMAHIPDFQWLIDTFIVDKAKVVDKFATASQTYTTNAVAPAAYRRETVWQIPPGLRQIGIEKDDNSGGA